MKVPSDVIRIVQTVNIEMAVFLLGMSCSVYGATLLDLAEVYESTIEAISYTLATRSAGSVFGGLCGGVVYRRLNSQLVTATCVLLGGVATILVPLLPSVSHLHVASFALGTVLSIIEIGNHVWLQVIWKEKSGPQLQLYNLIFGLGGVIAPFICEPFLSSHVQITTMSDNSTTLSHLETAEKSTSRIDVAYGIVGSIFLLNVASLLVSYRLDSSDPKPAEEMDELTNEVPKLTKYSIIGLIAIHMLIGVADETLMVTYLPTFVVLYEQLQLTKSTAAYLCSAFWLSYTFSRFVVTILTVYLSPEYLIALFQTILIVASLATLTLLNTSPLVIWIGTVGIAFGLSPYFGNVTVWGVQYILLTHNYMSLLIICVCIGAMLPGALIGPYIDKFPMIIMWGHIVCIVGLAICGGTLILYGRSPLLRAIAQKKAENERLANVRYDSTFL